jgi:hypothetical protein
MSTMRDRRLPRLPPLAPICIKPGPCPCDDPCHWEKLALKDMKGMAAGPAAHPGAEEEGWGRLIPAAGLGVHAEPC